jgi:hypothetical protein
MPSLSEEFKKNEIFQKTCRNMLTNIKYVDIFRQDRLLQAYPPPGACPPKAKAGGTQRRGAVEWWVTF